MTVGLSSWLPLAATTLILIAIQLTIVARHPEPSADEPGSKDKLRYAELVTPATVLVLGIVALLGSLPISVLPVALRPAWVVWVSAGLALVYVDARTTWLPISATAFTAGCLSVAFAIGLVADRSWWPQAMLRALVGAGLAWALFWMLWRWSGALGFGDVRLAALTGSVAGFGSTQWWFLAIFAGSVAAACWGLITMAWRRRHPSPLGRAFPYGPGLWLGPWIAWVWLAWGGAVPTATS